MLLKDKSDKTNESQTNTDDKKICSSMCQSQAEVN